MMHAKQKKRRTVRPLFIGAGVMLAVFAVVNIGMAVAYHGRVLPRYTLSGVQVGNVAFGSLTQRVEGKVVPDTLTLSKGGTRAQVDPSSLGVSVDTAGSIEDLKASRPLLPVMSLFVRHDVPARIAVRDDTYKPAAEKLAPAFYKAPLMKRVVFKEGAFTVASEEAGYQLDVPGLRQALISSLQAGKKDVPVATSPVSPPKGTLDLGAEVKRLQPKLGLKQTISYNGRSAQSDAQDIGRWYETDGETMKLSPEKIGKYVDTVAPGTANRSDLILALQYAVNKDQSLPLAAAVKGAPVRTYCTATRGVGNADLNDLKGKLAATYADPRGWGLDGRMAFQYVESSCEYTVWLAAPGQMTSFGEICDDYYNCQVGTNVIVNDERWNKATEPWVATGASIEDYRVLVINHETGHRLGFLDNNTCPTPGGSAPVMMQQSVDLLGCMFNRFPTTTELDVLRAQNGL